MAGPGPADLLQGRDPATTTVRDAMSRGITWCFDDLDVDEAAHLMEEKKIRRLPIINHDKRMVGILSLDDIALNTPHELSGEVIEAVSRHH